ncbi:MAG: hypothetical protein GXY23_16955 [Myxococcales bacterium]|nr:hypothetical protein [Myxococcales bacterium]
MRLSWLPWGMALALFSGCAPQIGDDCRTSAQCSINADRFCDLAQPGGYCTVRGCNPDTCPDRAICVEWRFEPPRGTDTYCMERCSGDGDCREGDGYRCIRGEDLEDLWQYAPGVEPGTPIARIIDLSDSRRNSGFCAALE